MSVFLDNARKIFEVARADANAADTDFALMVGPNGGLHIMMEPPWSLDAVSIDTGARAAYRVTRSSGSVTVTGHSMEQNLVLEDRSPRKAFVSRLLRDQPLYRMTSPVLASASGA